MIRITKGKELTWYDVEEPTPEDVETLKRELNIHALILEELIPQVRHPKLELVGSHLFLVLTIPTKRPSGEDQGKAELAVDELDIIFGKSWIVTSHYRPIDIVDGLFERLSRERRDHIEYLDEETPAIMLYMILSGLLANIIRSLGGIEERVERAERELAQGLDRSMVHELAVLRREIIEFRRALSPARPVFRALDDAAPAIVGSASTPYFRNLTGRMEQIATLLKTLKETVEALEETTHMLLTTQTNDIVRIFTILTALFIPPTIITSIFSMNIRYPFNVNDPATFWWMNGITFALIIPPLIYLRKRKWL